jgi:hypothetical protein
MRTRDTQLQTALVALGGAQDAAIATGARYRHFADADALRGAGVPIPADWAARCDEYLGPLGAGYVLHVTAGASACAVAFGPEPGFGHDWREAGDDD